jgi:hypothetical protein
MHYDRCEEEDKKQAEESRRKKKQMKSGARSRSENMQKKT